MAVRIGGAMVSARGRHPETSMTRRPARTPSAARLFAQCETSDRLPLAQQFGRAELADVVGAPGENHAGLAGTVLVQRGHRVPAPTATSSLLLPGRGDRRNGGANVRALHLRCSVRSGCVPRQRTVVRARFRDRTVRRPVRRYCAARRDLEIGRTSGTRVEQFLVAANQLDPIVVARLLAA